MNFFFQFHHTFMEKKIQYTFDVTRTSIFYILESFDVWSSSEFLWKQKLQVGISSIFCE